MSGLTLWVLPLAQTAGLAAAQVSQSAPVNVTAWTPLGPAPIVNGQRASGSGPVSGRITGIAAHPSDPSILYIAAAGGGVWKTIDGGTTWTPQTDFQTTLSMGAIAVAQSSPNVIYAGTGEANNCGDCNLGSGILVSTDGGITWTLHNPNGVFNHIRGQISSSANVLSL
jgi:photosystem II stability/assembly factor-like uncharacterized protein